MRIVSEFIENFGTADVSSIGIFSSGRLSADKLSSSGEIGLKGEYSVILWPSSKVTVWSIPVTRFLFGFSGGRKIDVFDDEDLLKFNSIVIVS